MNFAELESACAGVRYFGHSFCSISRRMSCSPASEELPHSAQEAKRFRCPEDKVRRLVALFGHAQGLRSNRSFPDLGDAAPCDRCWQRNRSHKIRYAVPVCSPTLHPRSISGLKLRRIFPRDLENGRNAQVHSPQGQFARAQKNITKCPLGLHRERRIEVGSSSLPITNRFRVTSEEWIRAAAASLPVQKTRRRRIFRGNERYAVAPDGAGPCCRCAVPCRSRFARFVSRRCRRFRRGLADLPDDHAIFSVSVATNSRFRYHHTMKRASKLAATVPALAA